MKKSKLVSLLSIPVFSLAAATTSCYAPLEVYHEPQEYSNSQQSQEYSNSQQSQEYSNVSQEQQKYPGIKTETVAAGVIDFLLGNPKTANLMNPTQQLALGIVGNLFATQGQRKHEIDYATAGKSQMIINTNDGRQAQFVRDPSGNVYIVMNNTIYPVSPELINQARGISPITSNIRNTPLIEGATLSPYNLIDLENRFNSSPMVEINQDYKVKKGGEYLSSIARDLGVSKADIFYWKDLGGKSFLGCRYWAWSGSNYVLRPMSEVRELWESRKKIRKGSLLRIVRKKYKNEVSAVFSYKWCQDLNHDGVLSFDEFNQVKRTFYDNEDFNIGIKYQTEKGFKGALEIKILEGNTGEFLTNEKVDIVSNGPMLRWKSIPKGTFPEGTYLTHVNLIGGTQYFTTPLSSQIEKFEIIKAPETKEKK